MKKTHSKIAAEDLRLHPERRLCSTVNDRSLRLDPLLPAEEMGLRVVDDCPREHMQ